MTSQGSFGKAIILILVVVITFVNKMPAQQLDAVSNTFKKSRQHLIELQKQIVIARQDRNLEKEFDLRVQLIYDLIDLTFDNNRAYLLSLELEEFVNKYPSLKEKRTEVRRNLIMGSLLRHQFRYEEALTYFKRALEMSKIRSWFSLYKDSSGQVLEALSHLNRHSLVNQHFHNSIAELDTFNLKNEDIDSFRYLMSHSFGEHFARNQQFDSAIHYTRISLKERNQNQILSSRYRTMSWIYLESGKSDSSIYYGEKSVALAKVEGLKKEEFMAYDVIRIAYERIGDTANAFKYLNAFFELKEEVASYDDAIQIASIELKNEQDRALLKELMAEKQLSSQRITIWIVVAGMIILIATLFYLYSRLKVIRAQNVIIAQARDQAERSERYKEEFLTNMSHEIRTPIHAISGMLKILRRNPHPEVQDIYLDAMSESSDNLANLLNDVIDLSKIESGKLTILNEPFELRECVRLSIELLKSKAEDKDLSLELLFLGELPEIVNGDALRLTQILINLINNAIKFSDHGKIMISIKSEALGIRFTVSDQGKGISDEDQNRIFSSFVRAGTRQSNDGSGLGLTISKHLVELLNGSLELRSQIGKGSTFSFILPLKEYKGVFDEAKATEDELKSVARKVKSLKILLVEDTEFNVMIAKDDLAWYFPDSKVDVAHDGEEAFRAFGITNYDLVLMDVQMPNMDGYQSTKKIRKFEVKNNLEKKPIIAMTASLLKTDIRKCLEAGMNDILPKPYKPEELVLKIVKVLGG